MHPYRVFISYSREDVPLARELDVALTRVGVKPVWDPQIQPGERFTDQIKTLISHSHLFVPSSQSNLTQVPGFTRKLVSRSRLVFRYFRSRLTGYRER